jgi:hypothetical protein
MNERLKELAVQAGATVHKAMHGEAISFLENDLERFAELVRQDETKACAEHYLAIMRDAVEQAVLKEREACAKLCESMGVYPELNVWNGGPDWYKRQKECAAAIRARGEK